MTSAAALPVDAGTFAAVVTFVVTIVETRRDTVDLSSVYSVLCRIVAVAEPNVEVDYTSTWRDEDIEDPSSVVAARSDVEGYAEDIVEDEMDAVDVSDEPDDGAAFSPGAVAEPAVADESPKQNQDSRVTSDTSPLPNCLAGNAAVAQPYADKHRRPRRVALIDAKPPCCLSSLVD